MDSDICTLKLAQLESALREAQIHMAAAALSSPAYLPIICEAMLEWADRPDCVKWYCSMVFETPETIAGHAEHLKKTATWLQNYPQAAKETGDLDSPTGLAIISLKLSAHAVEQIVGRVELKGEFADFHPRVQTVLKIREDLMCAYLEWKELPATLDQFNSKEGRTILAISEAKNDYNPFSGVSFGGWATECLKREFEDG